MHNLRLPNDLVQENEKIREKFELKFLKNIEESDPSLDFTKFKELFFEDSELREFEERIANFFPFSLQILDINILLWIILITNNIISKKSIECTLVHILSSDSFIGRRIAQKKEQKTAQVHKFEEKITGIPFPLTADKASFHLLPIPSDIREKLENSNGEVKYLSNKLFLSFKADLMRNYLMKNERKTFKPEDSIQKIKFNPTQNQEKLPFIPSPIVKKRKNTWGKRKRNRNGKIKEAFSKITKDHEKK